MKSWLGTKINWLIVKPSRLTVLACAGLIGVYAGWLGYIIVKDRPIDFYVYYIAAEDLARGGDPYTISNTEWDSLAAQSNITNYTSPYRYPPQSAVLLTFFRPLGSRGAMIVWVIADAAAMILGAWILGKALGGGWWLPLSLSTLLIFIPPLATLLAGQVNGFIFLCLAIAFAAIKDHRAGRIGISLAIGAALKVIPVALIFYSFWRRQWKAGLIGIGTLAALTVICLPIADSSVLTSYARSAVALGSPSELTSTPTNQTITAVLQRFLPLDLAAATSIGRWLSLLVIVITIGVCWPIGPTELLLPFEFGLIVAALQLIPPFTWYHQLVLLLVPLLIVIQYLWTHQQRRWLWWLVALFVLTDVHGLIYRQLSDISPLLASFPFVLGLTLWIMLAVIIIRQKVRPVSITPLTQPS